MMKLPTMNDSANERFSVPGRLTSHAITMRRWMRWIACGAVACATTGCALPQNMRVFSPATETEAQSSGQPGTPVANAPETNTPATNTMATATTGMAASAPTNQRQTAADVRQVGYTASLTDLPMDECQSTLGQPCGQCNACATGQACTECGNNACTVCQPHGYTAPPAMYNAYGIDPQEFLCDGGDANAKAFLRQDDTIAALDPEDTVVHFTNRHGQIEFAESNRVCLYAPRFASVRRVTGASAGGRVTGAVGVAQPVGPERMNLDQPGLVVTDTTEIGMADTARRIDAMRDRNRGVPVDAVLQPILTADVFAVLANIRVLDLTELRDADLALLEQAATAAIAWSIEESVEVAVQDLKPPVLNRSQTPRGFTEYDFGDGRLVIGKFADKHHAQPGDIVEFALRVDNVGDGPVSHVTVTDNLTTRLAYIDGSQSASCEADFEVVQNDVESAQLIWTIRDELAVGESAILRFKCRVR
ncbi:hypothetical protein V7x_08410 [Crateriforma conspicua]|uniref:DUF11 domain-containing protein n=2 Tax=Planctomycetaceae TaxID=126 RepID=A0A5C6FUR4_9PLAN|nr:hypothetical protein V7x_08410 [Crateriforma conspicua]